MIDNVALPRVDNLLWLKTLARPYPATAGEILETAKFWKFDSRTTDLLELLPQDMEFKDEQEFMDRAVRAETKVRELHNVHKGSSVS